MSAPMPPGDRQTLERLLKIAERPTGQGELVANLLLAWWNATSCGGFNVTDLWGLDRNIAIDCCKLIGWLATNRQYPDELGYGAQFEALARFYRPSVMA